MTPLDVVQAPRSFRQTTSTFDRAARAAHSAPQFFLIERQFLDRDAYIDHERVGFRAAAGSAILGTVIARGALTDPDMDVGPDQAATWLARCPFGLEVAMVPSKLSKGSIFAGDYRIEDLLKEGGMGSVYIAEQVSTGALRALKLMLPQLVRDPRMRKRFELEARVGARIQSDHVVQVVGAGVDDATDTPWLAMELLDGEDLEELLNRRAPLPQDEVQELFRQLCHALAAAHAVGIVHRDLKPQNIFVAAPRQPGMPFLVKVLDFGISKALAEYVQTTQATGPVGTPLWMAPEQTQSSNSIVPATDVWPLGLIAFRMLTGHFYWREAVHKPPSMMGLLREVCMERIVLASQRAVELGRVDRLPPGFDEWFAQCVHRETTARFQDAGQAHAAFVAMFRGASRMRSQPTPVLAPVDTGGLPTPVPQLPIAASVPAAATPVPAAATPVLAPEQPRTPRHRRSRSMWIALGATGVATVIFLAVLLLQLHRSPRKPMDGEETVCNKGDPAACLKLGAAYEHGLGVPTDKKAAIAFYSRACAQSSKDGCERAKVLAGALATSAPTTTTTLAASTPTTTTPTTTTPITTPPTTKSPGIKPPTPPTDIQRCNRDDGDACLRLAVKASNKGDAKGAWKYAQKACKSGNREGCKIVATMGVLVCNAGVAQSCHDTAEMLMSGQLGGIDFGGARQLFQKGCALNSADCCKHACEMNDQTACDRLASR